jgi:membrane associated rhomboid family serine protease
MLYMQVDVPMDRVPVSNWVLIAATILFTIKGWSDEGNVGRLLDAANPPNDDAEQLFERLRDRRLTEAQREQLVRQVFPDVDSSALQQLKDSRLSDRQRAALIANELEQWYRRLMTVPSNAYALSVGSGHFRAWQLVSYQFVHADFWHLFGNMLFLFCFGNAVNAKLGHLPFLGLYLGCGAFAGLVWLMLGEGGALVGASGAIAGITGAFLILYPLNEVAVWITGGVVLRVPSWLFIAFYMAMDMIGTLSGWGGGVAYVCHLGGQVLGITATTGLVLSGVVRSGRGERNLLEIWGMVARPKRGPRPLDT